jgi:hypothetical protein
VGLPFHSPLTGRKKDGHSGAVEIAWGKEKPLQLPTLTHTPDTHTRSWNKHSLSIQRTETKPVWRWVSKGVKYGCRPQVALQAGHPRNSRKAVLGVSRPQGIEGSGMVDPGETLGSPCIRALLIFLAINE